MKQPTQQQREAALLSLRNLLRSMRIVAAKLRSTMPLNAGYNDALADVKARASGLDDHALKASPKKKATNFVKDDTDKPTAAA